jgi:hypothetical protein
MKKVQYAVWDEEGSEEDGGYWLLYDTLEDAVSSHSDLISVEVFRMEAKSIGRYKKAVKMVRLKKRKKK